jgi:predicted phage terminase large subunit-like protein
VLATAPRTSTLAERLESEGWQMWLATLFWSYISRNDRLVPFAPRHEELWEWFWNLRLGHRPRPFVGIWPRGGAKSTTAEMGVVMVGGRRSRTYVLYVSGTQDQADDHVANVAGMLESRQIATFYPELGTRLLSKFGHSRGWRRNRLRAAGRFTVDAIGLDKAARGLKLDELRPDLIVLDDIDAEDDSPDTVEKKIRTLTTKILPLGARDMAVLAIQNLVHANSIFSRLASDSLEDGADFLADRYVSGPHPAVQNLQHEERDIPSLGRRVHVITGGEPTWEGQDLEVCQAQIVDWGLRAFLKEAQQEVKSDDEAFFQRSWWRFYDEDELAEQGLKPQLISVDAADEDGQANDWTAMSLWGKTPLRPHDLFVMDAWQGHVNYPALKREHRQWSERFHVLSVVENRGNGRALIQEYRQPEWEGPKRLSRVRIIPFDPSGVSKEQRAKASTATVAAGLVYLPRKAPWLKAWIEQHALFPDGPHDDLVDTTSQAIPLLNRPQLPARGTVRAIEIVGKGERPQRRGWGQARPVRTGGSWQHLALPKPATVRRG